MKRSISPKCSSFEHVVILISASFNAPFTHSNCPSNNMSVTIKPRSLYSFLIERMLLTRVSSFAFVMYSIVENSMCLDFVTKKRRPLMKRTSPAKVTYLYLSKSCGGILSDGGRMC